MPARPSLSPRKSASQQRSAATVAAILEAAARVLERGGLEAFTTNAVAARAGVSIGSLYQYFPGKDALMAALIAEDAAAFQAALAAAVAQPGTSLEDDVARLVDVAVSHQLERPALARILDFEERRLALGGEAAAQKREIGKTVVTVLSRHAACLGELDLVVAAGDLAAMTRGITDEAGARGELEADALKRRVLRAALGYLLGPAGRRRSGRYSAALGPPVP